MTSKLQVEAEVISENDLLASICRDSLWEFVKEFWGEITSEPLVENWHLRFLCWVLQSAAERAFQRQKNKYDILINIAPETTKSTLTSVMFPIWMWTHAPWIQTICASYALSLSLDLASKSRDIVQSAKFRALFPDISLRSDRNTVTHFQNLQNGWRYATSTGGSMTGMHGHFIIIDDPLNPKEALSPADLKTATEWLTNVVPKRKVSQENTTTIMIMQRLSRGDPSALWLDFHKRGMPLFHICLPAKLTGDVRPAYLRKYYKNGLLDPHRLGESVLKTQRLIGAFAYSAQYLQNPLPVKGGMFHTGKIAIEEIETLPAGWPLVRYWDKAGTPGGGAYTVGVLMGKSPHDFYWIFDVVRGQWDASERERIIKQTAQRDGIGVRVVVEQEPGSSGKEAAQSTIRNLAGFRVAADRPTGSKVARADSFAAVVNEGFVKMRKAVWNADYLTELSFFPDPGYKYKDQVDASSGAFNHLVKPTFRVGMVKL